MKEKPSPTNSSANTFGEYDINGLDDLVTLNNLASSTPNRSHLPELSHGTPLLLPLTSEDEGDSAISGKSSEINESRSVRFKGH